jgi:tryptophanyl-tRNA synthetase
MADPAHVDGILRDGADRARALARPVLADVQEIVGFIRT